MTDAEAWRWFWTGLAVVLSLGEIFTAGFFLLPFGIGAGASALLAWFGVDNVALQWLVFVVVTVASLLALRPLIRRQDEDEAAPIGANRFLQARGVVLEDIVPHAGKGMVRVEQETWRATTADRSEVGAGSEVIVTGVTGSRLVVTPAQDRQT